jgi:hypothetical protein
VKLFLRRHQAYIVPIAISIIAWLEVYALGLTTAYNDAKSHANIPRLIIDNLQPGLTQLGTVWLPLPHLLALPLIWITPLWHSGLASSVASMGAFVLAVAFMHRIGKVLGFGRYGSLIGAAVLGLNLNFLYLQSTPLTESLYLGLFTGTLYFMIRYLQISDVRYLVPLGFLTAGEMLTRYDGWFAAGAQLLVIIGYDLFKRRLPWGSIFGRSLLYIFPAFVAGGIWLLYNLLIFGNALYFAVGDYSAKAQQASEFNTQGLITKHSWFISSKAYGYLMLDNVGYLVVGLALVGLIVFMIRSNKLNRTSKWLMVGLFTVPIIFNVLSLYLGITAVNTPELHWNPSGQSASQWFNVRYGILILPAAAICVAALASINRYLVTFIAAVIVAQTVLTATTGIITITDGTVGLSNFRFHDIPAALKTDVQPGDNVLMSFSYYSAVAFDSGLPLRTFVHEGVSREWKPALKSPQSYRIRWVVMANGATGEAVNLSLAHNPEFLSHYRLAQQLSTSNIYELRNN